MHFCTHSFQTGLRLYLGRQGQKKRMLTRTCLQSAMAKGVFLKQHGPGNSLVTCREPALDIIVRTAIMIAEGMAYMHERDILHCDLSKGDPPCCSKIRIIVI